MFETGPKVMDVTAATTVQVIQYSPYTNGGSETPSKLLLLGPTSLELPQLHPVAWHCDCASLAWTATSRSHKLHPLCCIWHASQYIYRTRVRLFATYSFHA